MVVSVYIMKDRALTEIEKSEDIFRTLYSIYFFLNFTSLMNLKSILMLRKDNIL